MELVSTTAVLPGAAKLPMEAAILRPEPNRVEKVPAPPPVASAATLTLPPSTSQAAAVSRALIGQTVDTPRKPANGTGDPAATPWSEMTLKPYGINLLPSRADDPGRAAVAARNADQAGPSVVAGRTVDPGKRSGDAGTTRDPARASATAPVGEQAASPDPGQIRNLLIATARFDASAPPWAQRDADPVRASTPSLATTDRTMELPTSPDAEPTSPLG